MQVELKLVIMKVKAVTLNHGISPKGVGDSINTYSFNTLNFLRKMLQYDDGTVPML